MSIRSAEVAGLVGHKNAPVGCDDPDAIVIGSGPNGLAAAITIARAGHSVVVYEAEDTIGGGTRSAELTLPGFIHDVCSSVHPMGVSSPFFGQLGLEEFGLRWIQPEAALAHPFDGREAMMLSNPFDANAAQFGADQQAVLKLIGPLVKSWRDISDEILRPAHFPKHITAMSRFGWNAIQPASRTAARFRTNEARAVFAGMAGHSILPLNWWASSAFGLTLWTTCYATGWPFAAGGSQSIAVALTRLLNKLGGKVITGHRVKSLDDLPKARAILCDVTPRQFLEIGGSKVAIKERQTLQNYRYGPGVFKIDWALNAPIPWNSQGCSKAGTVHIGGSFEEIAKSEQAAWSGVHAEKPFVLLVQPSLFDSTRAPRGKHTAWAYCHVPHGSTFDMQARIEAQIERFASGFRKCILARSVMSTRDFASHNSNLIGGDIAGGSMEFRQLFMRPSGHLYSTSIPNVFLCSASTPPGPGVHGMCGHLAAQRALQECF
jgi:phytoene dehydrogenase-like protein